MKDFAAKDFMVETSYIVDRPVAALVYHRQHVVNLSRGCHSVHAESHFSRNGYNVVQWSYV